MTLPILALAFLSAAAPVVAWFFILRQKDSKGMGKRYLVTFALSAIGGVMFVLFQGNIIGLLQNQIASLFFVFLLVGMVMEYFKNYVIRFSGVGAFRNIDDVIDLSFAAALGFTFGENIVEFSITFSGNNAAVQGPIQMLKYFLIREFFILPIHLFSSGLFGYFYGMGLFASKELREQNNKDFFFRIYSQFFVMLSEERRFKAVKILQGTTLSVLSYGVFFTLYQKKSDDFRYMVFVWCSRHSC
jgi:hypothetical protein